MPARKASDFPVLPAPSASATVLMLDPGASATSNYRADRAALLAWLGRVDQDVITTATTRALTFAQHQGATVVLGHASATVSLDAAAVGDGFACKIVNDRGSDWTVPTPTSGTLRFDQAGDTKVAAGGSVGLEVYTRGGTRYVHVTGTTVP